MNDLYPRSSIETRLTHAVMEQAQPLHLTRLEAGVVDAARPN